jgi:hypothetical protein
VGVVRSRSAAAAAFAKVSASSPRRPLSVAAGTIFSSSSSSSSSSSYFSSFSSFAAAAATATTTDKGVAAATATPFPGFSCFPMGLPISTPPTCRTYSPFLELDNVALLARCKLQTTMPFHGSLEAFTEHTSESGSVVVPVGRVKVTHLRGRNRPPIISDELYKSTKCSSRAFAIVTGVVMRVYLFHFM